MILTIGSEAMAVDGHVFYLADNGIWLTGHVPVGYIVGWE